MVNKAMFIGGYNTGRETTATPPTLARHENTPPPGCVASPIRSRCANSPSTYLASRPFSPAIAANSNRHTPRLENAISRRKQTLGSRSNRHFFTLPAANFRALSLPSATGVALRRFSCAFAATSNRQCKILENVVSHRKQTLASRSNRQLFAILQSPRARVISSDRPSFIVRHAPLPCHYNLGVIPCRHHTPNPVTRP